MKIRSNTMNTISVIMSIYNTDEFLEQSIQSVLDQSYQDLELILINDNSNDGSQKIIEYFAKQDRRVDAHAFEEHKGVGKARNFGIEQATGKYLYFLDSDDYLAKNTLELLIQNIKDFKMISGKHKRADVSELVEDNGNGSAKLSIKILKEDKYNLIKDNSVLNHL